MLMTVFLSAEKQECGHSDINPAFLSQSLLKDNLYWRQRNHILLIYMPNTHAETCALHFQTLDYSILSP